MLLLTVLASLASSKKKARLQQLKLAHEALKTAIKVKQIKGELNMSFLLKLLLTFDQIFDWRKIC